MRLQGANKSSIRGHAGDNGVEGGTDSVLHGDGGEALEHIAFDFTSGIFFLGAVGGDGGELVVGIRVRPAREHRLDQALSHDVWKAAVSGGGVGVILHGKAEMAG